MTEHERLLHANTDNSLSENDREVLSRLAEQFNLNTRGMCWQQFKLLSRARNVTSREHCIYTVGLYTLNEQRWHTEKFLPYNDNEPCPDSPIGDIWKDYQFDMPEKTMLAQDLSKYKDLDHTRRREVCSLCQSNNQNNCSRCKGRGSVVIRSQLNVKWYKLSSNFTYPHSDENFCCHLNSYALLNQIKCLDFDDIWPSTTDSLDSILNNCNNVPEGVKDELNRKFLTHQSSKILRLKCVIECLRVVTINYQLQGLPNVIFTFRLIGEDRQLHIDKSSYPSRSQQFNTSCILL